MANRITSSSTQALVQKIKTFTKRLRLLSPEDINAPNRDLYDQFSILYNQALSVDRADLTQGLSSEDATLFGVLMLGFQDRAQLGDPSGFSSLVSLVVHHPDFQRHALVAEFLKSPEGHQFSSLGGSLSKEHLDQCLLSISSQEGVREVLNSLRAEEIGRFIGYVASHQMETDISRYKKLVASKMVDQSMEVWLVDRIRQADEEFVVMFEDRKEGLDYGKATGRFTGAGAPDEGQTRASRRPDHMFFEYGANNRTIVAMHCGNSTSERHNTGLMQGTSAVSYLAAVLNVSHDSSSPLHKVAVKPYYFLTGLFCVDKPVGSGAHLTSALQKSNLARPTCLALAQIPYLSLLANNIAGQSNARAPHPDRTLALLAHNPHISGCDTLDLHGVALEIQDALASGMTPARREILDRRALHLLSEKISLAAEGLTMAMPNLFVANSNLTASHALLNSFTSLAQSIPFAVSVKNKADAKHLDKMRESIKLLSQSLSKHGHHEYIQACQFAMLALERPRDAEPSFGMARTFSDYEGGLPKLDNKDALGPEVILRSSLRALADELESHSPSGMHLTTIYHRSCVSKLTAVLRAAPNSKNFVGLADSRTSWRKDVSGLVSYYEGVAARKKISPDLIAALKLVEEHAFVGRTSGEKDSALKDRVQGHMDKLTLGLQSLGFGIESKLICSRPREMKR